MERLGDALKRLVIPERISVEPADSAPEEQPTCPLCRGAGFLRRDVPVGHPDFGKIVPCRCREEEHLQQRRARLERLSNLGPLTRLTFESLEPEGRSAHPAARARYRRAVQLARTYAQTPAGWLVLVGPPGCGKTHIAAAIANARIDQGEPVLFVVVPDLLDHLRATFTPTSEVTYDELFENVRTVPLLVLDDLGTQSSTPWAMEKLYQIFNHRYNAQLPTIVTTNHTLEELDERLRARLEDPNLSTILVLEERRPPILERLDATKQELLRTMTFEAFDPQGHCFDEQEAHSLQMAYRAAKQFAEHPEGWLVLQGLHGCGKTHLAAAIANYNLLRGRTAYFVAVPDLLDYLRGTYSPDSPVGYDELFEMIRTAPLLILDDLGTQSSTPWAEEKLFQLFNYRYNARLPTVITTNFLIEDLDPRLGSRMSDVRLSNVIPILAPDYRASSAGPRSRARRGGGRGGRSTKA